MFNVAQQWNRCLDVIKANLPTEQFNAWFAPIVAVDYDQENNHVTLKVPSEFYREKIEGHYLNILSLALKKVFGENVKLFYKYNVVRGDDASSVKQLEDNSSVRLKQELKIRGPHVANPFERQDSLDDIDPQLNPRYTFENYCGSMSNKLAVSVANAISTHPEVKTYNPFFVFGSTGVGKTHLLQAVGIKLKEDNPRMRVLYVTARVFENQYTTAVLQKKVNDFINFYQSIDVLLLDDIQEFAGKPGTQNTFFHIFNHLHQHQRQLVMSSDTRPCELDGMVPQYIDRWDKNGTFLTETNHCGGVQGGISNGMPIEFRVAFHPVVSLPLPIECLHMDGHVENVLIGGRHDRCHIKRAAVVVEAMAAICLADCLV